MGQCEEIRAQMSFYLDAELHDAELTRFEAHLAECASCRQLLAREEDFLSIVREARPLQTAPESLRQRVEDLVGKSPSSVTSPWRRRPLALAACALIASLAAIGYWARDRHQTSPAPPSEFAKMAVDSHLRRLRGQLPLEIDSTSPEEISGWFRNKVSFSLTLPNYQGSSGQEMLYHLEGARLVAFRNDYAACVAYRMRQRPITLIVTSNAVAMPAGGEQIISKGLVFHYDAIDGLKVITWADRGLTYALVSDLEERGQQSCAVCHAGTKDRDFIEGLKPAPKI
jgi:mycothiol system anti-sigma-R factor